MRRKCLSKKLIKCSGFTNLSIMVIIIKPRNGPGLEFCLKCEEIAECGLQMAGKIMR